jgi:hypothetical protein
MAVEWQARAIVGQRVRLDALCPRVEKPACAHEKPESARFCPECGKSTRPEVVDQWLPGYKEDSYGESFGGLALMRTSHSQYVVLGDALAETDRKAPMDPARGNMALTEALIGNTKRMLYVVLSKHKLYDESQFGVWTMLDAG